MRQKCEKKTENFLDTKTATTEGNLQASLRGSELITIKLLGKAVKK